MDVCVDKQELLDSLKMLDWSQAELGRRLGVSANTVSLWATGQLGVPGYAAEYLRVVLLAMDALRHP